MRSASQSIAGRAWSGPGGVNNKRLTTIDLEAKVHRMYQIPTQQAIVQQAIVQQTGTKE